jgi:hypothetical protein
METADPGEVAGSGHEWSLLLSQVVLRLRTRTKRTAHDQPGPNFKHDYDFFILTTTL